MSKKPEKKEEPKPEPTEKKAPKRKVTAREANLNMYIYGNYGVEKDTKANIFYLGPRWIGAEWICPGLFEELLYKNTDELKPLADNPEELKKKITQIFKDKYLMLLWTRFSSIRDIVTDFVTEKLNTQEWDDAVKEATESPEEKTKIEFTKPEQ